MRFMIMVVAMLFVGAAGTSAQQVAAPADNCHTTLKAGSGPTFTKICISSTGNVTLFESPQGVEHLRVLDPIEGYRICRYDTNVASWDSGTRQSSNWSAPKISQPNGPDTLPLQITRDANGIRLVQDFFFSAPPYGAAELTIQMKTYNRTASPVQARIERFFDADINGTPDDDSAISTQDSVAIVNVGTNWEDPVVNRGVVLEAGILDKTHYPGFDVYANRSWTIESEWDECVEEFAGIDNFRGDFYGAIGYDLGSIPAGGVRTVSFVYRRF